MSAASKRGFTLIEIAVTLAVMGIVLAMMIPNISSAGNLSSEQNSKASLNGAMDTIIGEYSRTQVQGEWVQDGSVIAPPRPNIDAAYLTARGMDARMPKDADGNMDSKQQSTYSEEVSLYATYDTGVAGWAVAAASRAKSDPGDTGNYPCWMMVRWVDPRTVPGGQMETYMVTDNPMIPCSGQAAYDAYDDWFAAGEENKGSSWNNPFTIQ